jgi:hypothetical protein
VIHWEFIDWRDVSTFAIWFTILLMTLHRAFAKPTAALAELHRQCDDYEKYIQKLHALIKAVVLVDCMIRGGRPIVTKAAEGMTVEETQALVDKIFLDMRSTEGETLQ